MLDRDNVIVLDGVVKELHWTNPHVAIFIENAAAKPGVPEGLWVIELTTREIWCGPDGRAPLSNQATRSRPKCISFVMEPRAAD